MKFKLLLLSFLLSVTFTWGQTSPTAFDLSTGSWTLTGWNTAVPASSYPGNGAIGSDNTTGVVAGVGNGNMMFWKNGTTEPAIATAESANITTAYTAASGRIVGNGTSGFYFDNTGGVGVGSAVLAINTTNRTAVQVAWTGRTIAVGARQYGIRLQYRVGTSGAWTDANGTVGNILYSGGAAGTSQVMPVVTLPVAVENQPVVQLLWRFYYIGPATGTRPQFGVDDINVSSSPMACTSATVTTQPSVAGQTLCQGAAATAYSVVGAGTTLTYQWYSNTVASNVGGTLIAGATSASYTPSTAAAGTLYYYATVTASCGGPATSNVSGGVTVNGLPATPVGAISGTTPACGNTNLSFSGTAVGPEVYYWQNSAAGTSTANNASSVLNVTTTGSYYVRTYNGTCWSTSSVGPYAVTINTIPSVPTTANPAAACQGSAVTFTGTGSAGATSYTFWDAASGGTQYLNGVGGYTITATALTTPVALTAGTYTYYVQGESATCSGTVRKAVTVTINAIPADPAGSITVSANPSCGPATLSYPAGYYWQTTAGGTSTASPTSSNYTLNATGTIYVRAYNGTCWSTGSINSGAVTVVTAPAITVQPANQFVIVGNTATFNVTATNAASYQWQVSTNGGGSWSNIGVNANSYTTPVTTLAMSGYQYQVIVSGNAPCGSVTSSVATLTVTTAPCLSESFDSATTVPAGWGGTSTNDAVFGHYQSAPNCRALVSGADLITTASNYPTLIKFYVDASGGGGQLGTLEYRVGAGAWTTVGTFTATTAGATVSFDLTSSPNLTAVANVSFRISAGANSIYIDDLNVFCGTPPAPCATPTVQPTALSFSAITTSSFNGSFTAASPAPSGYLVVYSTSATLAPADLPVDATTYTAGTTLGDGTVAYAGTGTSFSISGLTSGTTYYVFVFSYNSGACAIAYNTTAPLTNSTTTVAAYCASSGNTTFNTSVTNVAFNTINNPSAKPSGYSDYTAISTTVQQGNSYPLSAKINTDGNFTVLAFAWIDFNHDLDFNDPGEAFDLGSATNVASGLSSASPLTINIPLTAAIGATRMRVIATYNGDSSPCLTGFDGEVEDYTVNIIAACVPTHSVAGFAPTSGPTGTDVTITGTGFTAGTTVAFNGVAATVVFVNATTIVATVPAGLTTGAITITQAGCKVITGSNFTQIKQTGTCTTGNNLTDLIISETYDSLAGNSWYVELYNPTGAPIDLDALGANYKIVRYGDIGTTNGLRSVDISGIIPAGGIYLADLGSDSSCNPLTYDYINKGNGINENDEIRLTKNDVTVDIVNCPNEKGYVIRRNALAFGPSATYSAADWTLLLNETCANLGIVPFTFADNLPTVNTSPSDATGCGTTASFSVVATPAGAGVLTYQWFYNNGVSAGWASVAAGTFPGVVASGFAASTLNLNGAIGTLNGYQFYCQVTQGGTCSTASDAAQLKVTSTTWDGTAWSNGTPDLTKLAIINGNYNTAVNGSFECCSLVVNTTFTLDIKDGNYVSIQNDLTVNGTLEVQNQGSLVMISDTGVVTNNGTTNVRKMSTLFDKYDYTFWSSPVANATISVFSLWQTNYIFKLDTSKFRDDNNDSHDDDLDAWVFTPQAEIMSAGRGYAAMGKIAQAFPAQQASVYSGAVNNGVITQPIALSLDNTKANDDFNLIGNPYPSAISADAFITANPDISGTLYFWTHEGDIQVAAINPGPLAYNFSPDDFAYYNFAGGVGTRAGLLSGNGNSNAPTGFIATGQGFQVDANAATSVTFNNSMRNKTHANTNFYRSASGSVEKDRLWLNLTNSEGIFSQQLVGFFPQATMGVDRGYDGYYVKSNTYAAFYSMIEDTPYKIQGRSAFDVNDRIPLGFRSGFEKTYSISIGDIEGVLRNQNVYVEDLQLNIIHDLKASPYVFSTPAGEFNNRFVLRFTNTTLGNSDFETIANAVMIYANTSINVTSSLERIKEVMVYDVLGRIIAEKKNIGNNSTEMNNVRPTKSALVVKVTLENGQVITKKVIY